MCAQASSSGFHGILPDFPACGTSEPIRCEVEGSFGDSNATWRTEIRSHKAILYCNDKNDFYSYQQSQGFDVYRIEKDIDSRFRITIDLKGSKASVETLEWKQGSRWKMKTKEIDIIDRENPNGMLNQRIELDCGFSLVLMRAHSELASDANDEIGLSGSHMIMIRVEGQSVPQEDLLIDDITHVNNRRTDDTGGDELCPLSPQSSIEKYKPDRDQYNSLRREKSKEKKRSSSGLDENHYDSVFSSHSPSIQAPDVSVHTQSTSRKEDMLVLNSSSDAVSSDTTWAAEALLVMGSADRDRRESPLGERPIENHQEDNVLAFPPRPCVVGDNPCMLREPGPEPSSTPPLKRLCTLRSRPRVMFSNVSEETLCKLKRRKQNLFEFVSKLDDSNVLVCSNPLKRAHKVARAITWGIDIVSLKWVEESLTNKKVLDHTLDRYRFQNEVSLVKRGQSLESTVEKWFHLRSKNKPERLIFSGYIFVWKHSSDVRDFSFILELGGEIVDESSIASSSANPPSDNVIVICDDPAAPGTDLRERFPDARFRGINFLWKCITNFKMCD